MLNIDMCLFYQENLPHANCMRQEHNGLKRNRHACKEFEGIGNVLNARTSNCCAWYDFTALEALNITKEESFCGLTKKEIHELKEKGEAKAIKEGVKLDMKEVFRDACCKDESKVGSFGDCDVFE